MHGRLDAKLYAGALPRSVRKDASGRPFNANKRREGGARASLHIESIQPENLRPVRSSVWSQSATMHD